MTEFRRVLFRSGAWLAADAIAQGGTEDDLIRALLTELWEWLRVPPRVVGQLGLTAKGRFSHPALMKQEQAAGWGQAEA